MDVGPFASSLPLYTALLFIVRSVSMSSILLATPCIIAGQSRDSPSERVVLGRVIRKIHEHPFRGHLFDCLGYGVLEKEPERNS